MKYYIIPNKGKNMQNIDVVRRWTRGVTGKNSNMRTDGSALYSYDLQIGYTKRNGDKVVYNYTASGLFKTRTTSKHVVTARVLADRQEDVPSS